MYIFVVVRKQNIVFIKHQDCSNDTKAKSKDEKTKHSLYENKETVLKIY